MKDKSKKIMNNNPDRWPETIRLKLIDTNGDLYEAKNAPLLHKNKANAGIYQRAAIILCNRSLYGCSFMSYQHNLLKTNKIENQ